MSNKRFSKSEWLFLFSLLWLTAVVIYLMIGTGWFDFEQNKQIHDCMVAGNTWKDGKCE